MDTVTIQYEVVAELRYVVRRKLSTEHTIVVEDLLLASSIDDARQTAKALTNFARQYPEEASALVLDFKDQEVH